MTQQSTSSTSNSASHRIVHTGGERACVVRVGNSVRHRAWSTHVSTRDNVDLTSGVYPVLLNAGINGAGRPI